MCGNRKTGSWAAASGPSAPRGCALTSMLSFEPFTLRDIGSPQVFQTGETFRRAALVDYQHPHDLLMGLGAELRMPTGRVMTILGADIVGSPTLGPPIFMHRPSAAENPQAPLSHHHLDSTHITPGVIRGGIEMQGIKLEASVFQGREPDEDRLDLDLGTLDSYATRLSFTRGAWYAQASAGWLTKPEVVTPYDATRLTASVAYTRGDDRRAIAWMAAFGQNREIHGNLEAYLLEATLRTSVRDSFYTRVESVAKDILDVGFHPVNTFHPHRQSQVGAATVGYIRDVWRSTDRRVRAGRGRHRVSGSGESAGGVRTAVVVARVSALPRTRGRGDRGARALIAGTIAGLKPRAHRPDLPDHFCNSIISTAARSAIAPPRSSAPFTTGRLR